jgi:hypothetical protein
MAMDYMKQDAITENMLLNEVTFTLYSFVVSV